MKCHYMITLCGSYLCTASLYELNTDKCTNILFSHHFINTICHSTMFQPLKGHLQGLQLLHLNSKVTTVDGAALVTHFVDHAVQMYQMYSLKMIL